MPIAVYYVSNNPMNQNVKCSVIGIVFSEDKSKILSIKRCDVPMWVLPGGGVDSGESPEDAVVREIYEETGLTTIISKQVALYTPINRLTNPTYVFECKPIAGTLKTGSETQGVDFFPTNALPIPFFFIHKHWIEDALKGLPDVIIKPLDQVTYYNFLKYFIQHPIQVIRLLLSRLSLPYNSK